MTPGGFLMDTKRFRMISKHLVALWADQHQVTGQISSTEVDR